MTDENTDADGVVWDGMEAPGAGADWEGDSSVVGGPAVTYPEMPPLPEARYSLCMTPDKPPMLTVRAQTAAEMTAALNELEAGGVYANIAAAYASLRTQGTLGAGLGPMSPPPPAPGPQGPPAPPQGATPPPFGPNVSVPQAPGYQAPPPQQGGWGGGAPRSNGPQEKPRPAGWAMVDVPFNDKERFKALRAQGTETGNYLRGKIQWGGRGTYWIDPSVAGWVAQQGFPVMQ